MKTQVLIVSGGSENIIWRSFISSEETFVIACDKGYSYAKNQNIVCDLILGDFDSYKGSIPQSAVLLPLKKDDTDTMFALKTALENGFKKIFITCAGGGRLDHFISNIQTLVYAKNQGACAVYYDDENEIYVLKNESMVFDKKEGYSFSVLSYSDVAKGVSIKGAEYPLEKSELTNSFPLGQSNSWKDKTCEVSVDSGILLVIMSKLN